MEKNMNRIATLAVSLVLAAAPVFAGGLAAKYIPAEKGLGQAQVIANALSRLPAEHQGTRGGSLLGLDARALIPMGMSLSPGQQETLEAALGGQPNVESIAEVLKAVDAQTRVYAGQEAARFLKDDAEGRIGDGDLSDAKTFASEFLVFFGAHLDAGVKASVFKAAAGLERRRLAVEEHKEMSLAQVMRELSAALTDERSEPAFKDTVAGVADRPALPLKDVTDPVFNSVLKKFDDLFIKAFEKKDKEAAQGLIAASYEAFANEFKPALERIGSGAYGSDEKAEIEAMRHQVRTYHVFLTEMMKEAGMPDAATVMRVKSLGVRDAVAWDSPEDINAVGRVAVLAAIDKAESKSRARTPDIEKMMPTASFLALESLSTTDDGGVVPHLKKVLKFYDKSLKKAGEGSYRKEVERKLATGFDGKVPTVQRVWEIWAEAKDKPASVKQISKAVKSWRRVEMAALVGFAAGILLMIAGGVALDQNLDNDDKFVAGIGLTLSSFFVGIASRNHGSDAESFRERFLSFGKLKWQSIRASLPWVSQQPPKE